MNQDPQARQFIISPLSEPSGWTPEPYQILNYPNENYLNSLWLGLVAPLVMFPTRLWNEVVRLALAGHLLLAAQMLVFIPISSIKWLWWGVRGMAYAVNAEPKELMQAHILQPHESLMAMVAGTPQVSAAPGCKDA